MSGDSSNPEAIQFHNLKLLLGCQASSPQDTGDHFQPARLIEEIVISIVVFLDDNLRNTDGAISGG